MRRYDQDNVEFEDYEREDTRHHGRRDSQRGTQGSHDDAIISKRDMHHLASDAFRESAEKLASSPVGKTKKLGGLITMDAGVVDMVMGLYNLGTNYASEKLRPRIFDIAKKVAPRVGLGQHASTIGAVATIGTTAALKTAGYFGPLYEGLSGQLKQQKALARALAPVLDDIKGGHSLASLYSVGIKDNEVIYAHRKRLNTIANAGHFSNMVNLGVNSGTNLAFDVQGFGRVYKDRNLLDSQSINRIFSGKPKQLSVEQALEQQSEEQTTGGLLKTAFLGMLPTGAERLAATKQHNLTKELQPYSAYEMIVELGEQLMGSPDARAFALPKTFQNPHGHRAELPLEEYLMRIFIQHQKDMVDISPNHTEIRKALSEDLAAAVRPLAAALRNGDISAQSLIRMVGECKIIKKEGRSIASVDEVKKLIKLEMPKQTAYSNDDPAEYYKDQPFTQKQLKALLKKLEGEEKLAFVSMFSDAILLDAGLSKGEVHKLREDTAKIADRLKAEMTVGLNAEDKIKTEVLAESEADRVAQASEAILEKGVGAMKALKTSPTNENGIERLLASAVVNKPEYLGKMLKTGHELMEKAAANDDQMADRPTHTERLSSRLQDKHGAEAGNDDQYLGTGIHR